MWRPVRAGLHDGWIITVDPPGFGDSPTPPATGQVPSLEAYARWLGDALTSIGADRVVLVGAAWGGFTALAFAEAYPERLAGIGLLATRAVADNVAQQSDRRLIAAAVTDPRRGRRLLAPHLGTVTSPVTRAQRPEVYEMLARWSEQAPATAIAWAQRAMAGRPNRLDVLQRLSVPALVLRGSDDVLNSPENVRKMAEALGTAVVTVPDAASMAAVEVPDLVVPALQRLWDEARAAELPRAAVQA